MLAVQLRATLAPTVAWRFVGPARASEFQELDTDWVVSEKFAEVVGSCDTNPTSTMRASVEEKPNAKRRRGFGVLCGGTLTITESVATVFVLDASQTHFAGSSVGGGRVRQILLEAVTRRNESGFSTAVVVGRRCHLSTDCWR